MTLMTLRGREKRRKVTHTKYTMNEPRQAENTQSNAYEIHDEWATTWQNEQNGCAPSEDSGQLGHSPSLIRVFVVRMKKAWILSYPLSAQRRLWSDSANAQADLSLCWAHMPFCWFCPGWSESSLGAHSFCRFCHVVAQIHEKHIAYRSSQSEMTIRLNRTTPMEETALILVWWQFYSLENHQILI